MRKISSKHDEELKRKKNGTIMGIVLIIIMLLSLMGYSFQSNYSEENNSKKIKYNGFEFIEQNGFWITEIKDFQFVFRYNPKQVERIKCDLKDLKNFYNKPLYIYSENGEAISEIYGNLFYPNKIVQRMQRACLKEQKCEEDLPTKTCEDNFIIIEEGDIKEIIQQENCVFIRGPKEDLIKITDEFLFNIIGIR